MAEQQSGSVETDEEECCQTIAVSGSEGRNSTGTAQLVKRDDGSVSEPSAVELVVFEESASGGDQRIGVVDSPGDSELTMQEEVAQQPPSPGNESLLEVPITRIDLSEECVVLAQRDQMEDERQDIAEEKEHGFTVEGEQSHGVGFEFMKTVSTSHEETVDVAAPRTFEEQRAAESVLSDNVAAAELSEDSLHDGDGKTGAVWAMSFAVCCDGQSTENFEVEPVCLPALSTADIGDVSQQPLMQAAVNAARVVFCVEPIVYELPETDLVMPGLDIPEVGAVQSEMYEDVGHLVEAAMNLPECECGVQELALPDTFDEFSVHLESPGVTTIDVVEVSRKLLLTLRPAVESDREEFSVGTSATEHTGIVEGDLSPVVELPGTGMQHEDSMVEYYDEIRHDDICLPETLEIVCQPTAETRVESEELPGAESKISLTAMWKYQANDRDVDVDEHAPTQALATEFCQSYSERNRTRHLMEEDLATTTQIVFPGPESPGLKVERERYGTDGREKEDVESVTSDEWCVVEKDDAGFDVRMMEDRTYKQVPEDVGDVSRLTEEFVFDSSTDEASTEYQTLPTSCTSSVVYDFVYDF